MKKGGDKEENPSTVQKNIENAAKKIEHRTNAQKDKEMMRSPENVRLREEAAARCTAKIKRRVLGQESQSWALGEMQLGAGEKEGKKKAADRIVC